MAHRSLEPLTESPHRLNPAIALYSQPVRAIKLIDALLITKIDGLSSKRRAA